MLYQMTRHEQWKMDKYDRSKSMPFNILASFDNAFVLTP